MLEINKESAEPEVEEFAMWNVAQELRLGTQVEKVHVQLLTEGNLNIPTQEKRGTQVKNDSPVGQVDGVHLRHEGWDKGLINLELDVSRVVPKPNVGRRLDHYVGKKHLDRKVTEQKALENLGSKIVDIPPLRGYRHSVGVESSC